MTAVVSAVACMRLLGRDADWDDAERATLINRNIRRHPVNLTTPRRQTQPLSFARPGPKP